MQRDSFTKALMATAKIACCASLLNVGCRTKTAIETVTPTPNTNDATNIVEDDASALQERASNGAFEECTPVLTNAFANGTFLDATEASQEVKDCCALTAEYYDNLAMANGMYDYGIIDSWTERAQCCAVNNWNDGSMACTPWGPPTPPSAKNMKRRIIVPARTRNS